MAENPSDDIPKIENNSDMNVARYDKEYLIECGLFSFVERNILKIVLGNDKYSVEETRNKIANYERGVK